NGVGPIAAIRKWWAACRRGTNLTRFHSPVPDRSNLAEEIAERSASQNRAAAGRALEALPAHVRDAAIDCKGERPWNCGHLRPPISVRKNFRLWQSQFSSYHYSPAT